MKQRKDLHRGKKVKVEETLAIGAVPVGAGAGPLAEQWDNRKTTAANYEMIGLDMHPNRGLNSMLNKGNPKYNPGTADFLEHKNAQPMDCVPAKTGVLRQIEKATVDVKTANAKVPPRMTFGEKDLVTELLERHGTNWKKMALDKRLNKYQHTAGVLRRKCERYVKIYGLNLNDFATPAAVPQ